MGMKPEQRDFENARDRYIEIQGKPVIPFCAQRMCWVRPGGQILRHEEDARRYAERVMVERERLERKWFQRHGTPRW